MTILAKGQKILRILTNRIDARVQAIADMFQVRGQIELFFLTLKAKFGY